MTYPRDISGQCLCGAVSVTARCNAPDLQVCLCDMCRRHTSSGFMSVSIEPGSLSFDGPARSFVSSDWAERGFCGTCGSTLWYGTTEDGVRYPAAGLFDNAADAELKLEFFADRCPDGYAFQGTHERLTEAQTIALFEGEGT